MFFQLRIFFHLPKLLVKTCELKAFPTIHGLTRLAPKSFLRNLLENVLRPKEGESQDPGKYGTWTRGDLTKEGGKQDVRTAPAPRPQEAGGPDGRATDGPGRGRLQMPRAECLRVSVYPEEV